MGAFSPGPASADDGAQRYRRLFLPLWVAMVALQSGLLVHDVAAGWLLASGGASRSLVALAQTASALPFFLCALPAGALADLVERRRVLQATAFLLSGASLLVALAVGLDAAPPALLLAASFLNGCANAAFAPTWQAITPELVDLPRLPGALALNSLGINVARSIGPLLSGVILAVAGPVAAFLFNALLFAAVGGTFLVLAPRHPVTPKESLASAVRAGLAYARHDPPLQRVALRAVAFFLFASTFWALAPVVVHEWFSGTGLLLGFLVGSAGIGAVLAALVLKRLRARFDLDELMLGAGILAAAALALVPLVPAFAALVVLYGVLGFCWLISFSSIHLAAQLRLAPWIRARGSAVYLIAVFGSIAVGSFLAGLWADALGVGPAYGVAAGCIFVATLAAFRLRITAKVPVVLERSRLLPGPVDLKGRVEVRLLYPLPAGADRAAARAALKALRAIRLRTGARAWVMAESDQGLEELLRYGDAAALERAAARQIAADGLAEQRLLDLVAPPVARVTAA